MTKGCYLCYYKYWRRNMQIFILVKAAVLDGIQQSSLITQHTHTQKAQQDRYLDKTNKKSGNYWK